MNNKYMIPNNSPWIKQLKQTRQAQQLKDDISTDVVVVGGGIAGITTCFFTLKNTTMNTVLVEADKVAHGATGHNAGQIVSYFEKPLSEIVNEFGLELAIDGQRSVESGWDLIDEIIEDVKPKAQLHHFIGYAGISNIDDLILHLKNNRCRLNGGLNIETICVSEECQDLNNIPEEYSDLYRTIPQKELLSLLETDNSEYIACLASKKGCMNSALFTEEILNYLISKYKDRFTFYENSPVKEVRLQKNVGILSVLNNTIKATKIVLCTNGFENFSIYNESGPDIDTTFHHLVNGRIGYMSGYVEPATDSPVAISYFPKKTDLNNDPTGDNYFYLTRRPHEHDGQKDHNLVCVGGPEKVLPNGASYSRHDFHSEETIYTIDDFLGKNYIKYPGPETKHIFSWHGLMGYTPNGVRCIGPEPLNETLMYNLGCNGVGILPSIFGGKRISDYIKYGKLKKSIFDPQEKKS